MSFITRTRAKSERLHIFPSIEGLAEMAKQARFEKTLLGEKNAITQTLVIKAYESVKNPVSLRGLTYRWHVSKGLCSQSWWAVAIAIRALFSTIIYLIPLIGLPLAFWDAYQFPPRNGEEPWTRKPIIVLSSITGGFLVWGPHLLYKKYCAPQVVNSPTIGSRSTTIRSDELFPNS